jgi:hypothetical protein
MNSAMYKKSDFELVGGYDVRFNKGWKIMIFGSI